MCHKSTCCLAFTLSSLLILYKRDILSYIHDNMYTFKHSQSENTHHMIRIGQPNIHLPSNEMLPEDSFLSVTFHTITRYFFKQNWYFLIIACLQVMSHPSIGWLPRDWSPTGHFSTVTPLLLCFMLEWTIELVQFHRSMQSLIKFNHTFYKVLRHETSYRKNKDIFPGDILLLEPNAIAPVDMIAMCVENNRVHISHSNVNGESRTITIDPVPSVNYHSHEFVLEITQNDLFDLHHFEAKIYHSSDVIHVNHSSFIVNGSCNVGKTSIVGIVVACGKHRKHTSTKNTSTFKPNTINTFIDTKIMKQSFTILMILITLYAIYTWKWESFIRAWITLNGVFPFSVKIVLTLLRTLQSSQHSIRSDRVDQFASIQWLIADKTGTLTQNKMKLAYIVDRLGHVSHNVSNDMRQFLIRVICRNAWDNPDTEEDSILHQHLLNDVLMSNLRPEPTSNLGFDTHRPMSSQVFRTSSTSDQYEIFTKGSPHMLRALLKSDEERRAFDHADQQLLNTDPSVRVLALVHRSVEHQQTDYRVVEKDFTFVGLIGFRDPLVPHVSQTIQTLIHTHDLSFGILTGDRKSTALSIAHELGVNTTDQKVFILNAEDTQHEQGLQPLLNARVVIGYGMTPSSKQTIVKWLQDHRRPCLAIGDGYNDMGMIQEAHIGVAVSNCIPKSDITLSSFNELLKIWQSVFWFAEKNVIVALFTMMKCYAVNLINFVFLITHRESQLFHLFTHQGFHIGWSALHVFIWALDHSTRPSLILSHKKFALLSFLLSLTVTLFMNILDMCTRSVSVIGLMCFINMTMIGLDRSIQRSFLINIVQVCLLCAYFHFIEM